MASYEHKPAFREDVFEAIKPIYEELSSDELFSRCLGGFIQNSNESFNATVWSIAPKSFSNDKKILDISTNLAICIFDDGLKNIMKIMPVLGITIDSTVVVNNYIYSNEPTGNEKCGREHPLIDKHEKKNKKKSFK